MQTIHLFDGLLSKEAVFCFFYYVFVIDTSAVSCSPKRDVRDICSCRSVCSTCCGPFSLPGDGGPMSSVQTLVSKCYVEHIVDFPHLALFIKVKFSYRSCAQYCCVCVHLRWVCFTWMHLHPKYCINRTACTSQILCAFD